ncbi:MAG TPA: hypothetical protein VM366_10210 [Anaerolineae bacterium]|nr:hypothetical protein [Anaerolineae bacterium]
MIPVEGIPFPPQRLAHVLGLALGQPIVRLVELLDAFEALLRPVSTRRTSSA